MTSAYVPEESPDRVMSVREWWGRVAFVLAVTSVLVALLVA